MIYDILDIFKDEYRKKGDKLILDNYLLKDGLYVKINNDHKIECYIFKNNKKEENKALCLQDLDGNIRSDMYDWFTVRDYYSSYLNSNKAFFDKKIHNINYLTLFVKVENFTPDFLPKIRGQFLALSNYKKFTKKEERDILKQYQPYLGQCSRKRDLVAKWKQKKYG